jgi:hypothetical protein
MQAPPFLCSICAAPKLATNHWQVAITRPGFEGIIFQPEETIDSPKHPDFVYEELCGQNCCIKRLSRYLDDLKAAFTPETETPDDHAE